MRPGQTGPSEEDHRGPARPDEGATFAGEATFRALRRGTRSWRVVLINGPNMPNLGPGGRDPRTYGTIGSLGELEKLVGDLADALGVELECFVSNHEGDVLEYIHGSASRVDGYMINPAGLNRVSEATRHALQETNRPALELHFANTAAVGWGQPATVFTRTVMGMFMGLRQYGYLGGLLALVLALDDATFLHPDGVAGSSRANGLPAPIFG